MSLSLSETATNIMNSRWNAKTKKGYQQALFEFFGWLESRDEYQSFFDPNTRELTSSFSVHSLIEFCSSKKKYDKDLKKEINLSFSALGRYRSALKHYLQMRETPLSSKDNETLTAFFSGLKKRNQNEKQAGQRPLREGKAEMPVELYESIAKYFYSVGDLQNATFLILTWNLACRSNNTADLKMCHITWLMDALKIEFGKTKANQEGDRHEFRLLFANPNKPLVCPVLALSLYVSTISKELSPSDKLFLGSASDTFLKALQEALDHSMVAQALRLYGLKKSDIGAHSIRKGAATYLCNGGTCAPSYGSICIRLSWTMGVKDRYIQYNPAADAYCGRILSLLHQNSTQFATLPPHPASPIDFETTSLSFPATRKIDSFELVRQFLLSSFLHHAPSILNFIPNSRHSIYQTHIFRNLSKLSREIPLITGISSPVLCATGLPPHVICWINDVRTQAMVEAIPDRMKSVINETLREAGVAAGNITPELLRSVLQEFINADREARTGEGSQRESVPLEEDYVLYRWQCDGLFHRLPENFEFPDITVIQGWVLYWKGHNEQKMPPFRFLQPIDVPKRWRSRFSDFRCIIRVVLEYVTESPEELKNMNSNQLIEVCHNAISKFQTNQKKKQTKSSEWKITTALREVRQARKRSQHPPDSEPSPLRQRSE